MEREMISKILNTLTQLLDDDVSPHSISYLFEKIAVVLWNEKITIEKVDCKEYYEDRDLALILSMKNEAIASAQFEQASKFSFIETELLSEKGSNELTRLKTEPFFFEYRNNCVLFHFNKGMENQRLIANLIERFSLFSNKVTPNKRLFC